MVLRQDVQPPSRPESSTHADQDTDEISVQSIGAAVHCGCALALPARADGAHRLEVARARVSSILSTRLCWLDLGLELD